MIMNNKQLSTVVAYLMFFFHRSKCRIFVIDHIFLNTPWFSDTPHFLVALNEQSPCVRCCCRSQHELFHFFHFSQTVAWICFKFLVDGSWMDLY